MNQMSFQLTVGDKPRTVSGAPGRRLSEVLRDDLGLKSVKVGCDAGDCGACTVLMDGRQHCACLIPLAQAEGRRIDTLEANGHPMLAGLQTPNE